MVLIVSSKEKITSRRKETSQTQIKSLTPQDKAVRALRLFEEAMDSLKRAFCLYEEFKYYGDPGDNHVQSRRLELQRTYQSK